MSAPSRFVRSASPLRSAAVTVSSHVSRAAVVLSSHQLASFAVTVRATNRVTNVKRSE